jgi:hypothetical protein
MLTELAEIAGEDDYCPLGEVPLEWVGKRMMGAATANGNTRIFVAANGSAGCEKLLSLHLEKFGLDDFDASVLHQTAPRILTQFVSRIVFFIVTSLRSD